MPSVQISDSQVLWVVSKVAINLPCTIKPCVEHWLRPICRGSPLFAQHE